MTPHTPAPGQQDDTPLWASQLNALLAANRAYTDRLLAALTEARDFIMCERNNLYECCTDDAGRYDDDEDAAHVAVIDELLARINAAIEGTT